MAVSVYIVKIEDFKERANISTNLLTDRFKQESGINQEIFAVKILCIELYNQLLTEIDTDTLTPANEALLPYLKDYLVFKIYADYITDANLIVTPAGFRTQKSNIDDKATESELTKAQKKHEGRANFYQDKLVNFLKCNADDYPLWKNSNCGCSDKYVDNLNRISQSGGKKKPFKVRWS